MTIPNRVFEEDLGINNRMLETIEIDRLKSALRQIRKLCVSREGQVTVKINKICDDAIDNKPSTNRSRKENLKDSWNEAFISFAIAADQSKDFAALLGIDRQDICERLYQDFECMVKRIRAID